MFFKKQKQRIDALEAELANVKGELAAVEVASLQEIIAKIEQQKNANEGQVTARQIINEWYHFENERGKHGK